MIWIIITFMVLYSIIQSCNSFFVINRHIARQDFILNDLFSGGRNPGKILKCTSQAFSTSVAMTSHKQKVAQKFYKRKQIYAHPISNIYRLIHGLFHIALVISSRPWYRHRGLNPEGRYQSRNDDKGNMKKAMY
jgi:hypothetical protein